MANYQLQLWQNNEIMNRNGNWHANAIFSSGFIIELHLNHRNNGVLSTTNWTFYKEDGVFSSQGGLQEFLIGILSAERIPVNFSTGRFLCDNVVHLLLPGPSGPFPVYTLQDLVSSTLEIIRSIKNNPMNRNLTLVPMQVDFSTIQFTPPLFMDDSIVLNGESLERGLSQLDDSIILDGELLEASMTIIDNQVIKLKEEKVEVSGSANCCICLESIDVGEIVARLPCSHLFHTTCITPWLHKHNKRSCPLCRASAS